MTDSRLPVIDAHAHVGAQQPQDHMPGYWPEGKNGQTEADMLACMDAAGVDYAVLHTCNVWGMKYAARMVREHGDRFIAVVKVDGGTAHLPPALEANPAARHRRGLQGPVLRPLAAVGRRLRQLSRADVLARVGTGRSVTAAGLHGLLRHGLPGTTFRL